jgi:hypothetical protein
MPVLRSAEVGTEELVTLLNLITGHVRKQHAHRITGACLIQDFPEGFDRGNDGCAIAASAPQHDAVAGSERPLVDPAGHDRAAAPDSEDIFNDHVEEWVGWHLAAAARACFP